MKKKRTCCVCSSVLVGKKSQRYCTKECQNAYDKIKVHFLRKVLKNNSLNKRIKRNYVILHGVLSTHGETVQIHRNNLFEHGFDMKAFIKIRKDAKQTIYIIEEFEFRILNDGIIEIKRVKNSKPYPIEFIRRWAFEFDVVRSLLKGKKLYLIQSFFKTTTVLNTPISVAKPFINNDFRIIKAPPS
ncbi:MAG: hypothetical protein ACPGU5_07240 [Lishizhenia sp.]